MNVNVFKRFFGFNGLIQMFDALKTRPEIIKRLQSETLKIMRLALHRC